MTVAEARQLLAKLPDATLLCFSDSETEKLYEVTQIKLVKASGDALEHGVFHVADVGTW
jgi:hypothetical protein